MIGSPAFLPVFLLAGRVRVLPAVPPPTDDRHPLPAADGELSEQRGNKGDGNGTRKKKEISLKPNPSLDVEFVSDP